MPPPVPHWVTSAPGQTAGPHLPELAQAQDVRREAALCPAGRPAWDPGGLRRGRRGRWEEAWAKLPQSWGHQPERALETGLAFPLAAGNAHTRVAQVNEQTAQARKAGGSRAPRLPAQAQAALECHLPDQGRAAGMERGQEALNHRAAGCRAAAGERVASGCGRLPGERSAVWARAWVRGCAGCVGTWS